MQLLSYLFLGISFFFSFSERESMRGGVDGEVQREYQASSTPSMELAAGLDPKTLTS